MGTTKKLLASQNKLAVNCVAKLGSACIVAVPTDLPLIQHWGHRKRSTLLQTIVHLNVHPYCRHSKHLI